MNIIINWLIADLLMMHILRSLHLLLLLPSEICLGANQEDLGLWHVATQLWKPNLAHVVEASRAGHREAENKRFV